MTEAAITAKLDALKRDAGANLSPGSQVTYDRIWSYFAKWCADNGHDALPATPTVVCGYLIARAEDGKKVATLRTTRNAIASKHRLAGLDLPTDDPEVKTCLRLLSRLAVANGTRASKQAPGIRLEHIKMLEYDKPLPDEDARWSKADDRRHALNCALVTVMHSAFMRVSEAAALRWGDIAFLANGQARITIRSSKTSADPETALLTTRAVGWLRKIMPHDPDMEARVFGVKCSRALHNRIRRAMKWIRPGATGHSPRVGAAQDMTIRGGSLQQVKEAGRWRSLAMPAYYASKVAPERGGVNLFED